jgi:hypothetical protein
MQQEYMDLWKRERVGYHKQYSVVDTELKETQLKPSKYERDAHDEQKNERKYKLRDQEVNKK